MGVDLHNETNGRKNGNHLTLVSAAYIDTEGNEYPEFKAGRGTDYVAAVIRKD